SFLHKGTAPSPARKGASESGSRSSGRSPSCTAAPSPRRAVGPARGASSSSGSLPLEDRPRPLPSRREDPRILPFDVFGCSSSTTASSSPCFRSGACSVPRTDGGTEKNTSGWRESRTDGAGHQAVPALWFVGRCSTWKLELHGLADEYTQKLHRQRAGQSGRID